MSQKQKWVTRICIPFLVVVLLSDAYLLFLSVDAILEPRAVSKLGLGFGFSAAFAWMMSVIPALISWVSQVKLKPRIQKFVLFNIIGLTILNLFGVQLVSWIRLQFF